MCRNIRPLFNFEPPATQAEIHDAARQFVRKLSGFSKPSQVNQEAFERAVMEVASAAGLLLGSLVTNSAPRDRDQVVARAKERSHARFQRVA